MNKYDAPIFPISPPEFEGIEPEELYQILQSLPPTPKGKGHIGPVKSGKFIHLRFSLPSEKPLKYFINLNNVGAYTGKGYFYQLEVRKDSPNGNIIFKSEPFSRSSGPYSFNSADFSKIEIPLENINEWHQGFIDIFVTVYTKGDTWTIYKDGGRRKIVAYALIESPPVKQRKNLIHKMIKRGILIVPQPRELNVKDIDFKILSTTKIFLDKGATEEDIFSAQLLADEIDRLTGSKLQIKKGVQCPQGNIVLGILNRDPDFDNLVKNTKMKVNEELGDQGYSIEVFDNLVIGAARHSTGLFYAVQTLIQLLSGQKRSIKGVSIRDWPALKYRMVQYDLARGQRVNLNYLKRIIRELSKAKINMLMIYMEDDFHYSKYPFLGREETFTPELAKELSEYANKYNIQLVPQQQSFGHMTNMLKHRELSDLREAGNSYAICPLNPRTHPFLTDLFTELSQAFKNSKFIHVGGDEFIWLYGKCPLCKSKSREIGVDGLYSLHLQNIYEIIKSLGKDVMIWTHMPPAEDELTLNSKRKGLIPDDIIPFLWFYGVGDFIKKIRLYKKAGFKKIFVSPSVILSANLYPPYRKVFINVRNYIKAAYIENCTGECTCTWGLRHGALFETCWYGLIYSSECAWSPEWTEKRFYDRKFSKFWFGNSNPEISEILFNPWGEFKDSFWENSTAVRNAFFTSLQRFIKRYTKYHTKDIKRAPDIIKRADELLESLQNHKKNVERNALTLELMRIPITMYKLVALKTVIGKEISRIYTEAYRLNQSGFNKESIKLLQVIVELLERLANEHKNLMRDYNVAIKCCGAVHADLTNFSSMLNDIQKFSNKMSQIIKNLEADNSLPIPFSLGLEDTTYYKIFSWSPSIISTDYKILKFDATEFIKSPGVYIVEWDYRRGAHALSIKETRVKIDGKVVFADVHLGWSGRQKRNQSYILRINSIPHNVKVEICGMVRGEGGTDSYGDIWIARCPHD